MTKLKHWSDSEYDVAERPSVVQSAEYGKLGKSVCRDAKDRPDEVYDEQGRGFWLAKRLRVINGDAGCTKDHETGVSVKVSWGLA